MKKISMLGVCALIGVGAFGQANVVKDAEKAAKSGKPLEEVIAIITPAFTNPETQNNPQTYMIPGKAGVALYDKMFQAAALGQLPADGQKIRSNALLTGYDYLMKALPLDSLPDEKGKVKTKHSKDILSTIANHYNDFNIIAVDFWEAQDWDKAYDSWDIYCHLPSDPRFAKLIAVVPNDTVIAEMMYNRSLAAFQTGDYEKATKSFLEAKDHGYQKKQLYDFALSAAYQAKLDKVVEQLCREALPLYGKEDSRYISQLINEAINNKNFNEAEVTINQAIENDPSNSQYYVIRGIVYEQLEGGKDAKSEYKKAIDLDPNNAQALYQYGRTIYNEAVTANDNAPTDPAEYAKTKATVVDPLLKEAAQYLENAWNVDNDYEDPLQVLSQVYYLLGDDAGMKSVDARKL